ncbi:hypothetical protein DPMN_148783 [Dreissena polymorpha]|uniref:Uncharacterized protein n=1 Tax=Dreissena polymorpha TaxID=45954 RepID=A0A9D4FAJ2_DREPO|nr:hypothetical protein DPMN_148783 [Dreissena polymorpha]
MVSWVASFPFLENRGYMCRLPFSWGASLMWGRSKDKPKRWGNFSCNLPQEPCWYRVRSSGLVG